VSIGPVTTYSHSRLSCFEQCPRRYRFRYIDEIEVEEKQGIEAFTGTLVHLSLQHLYEEADKGRVLCSKGLVEHLHALWKEKYDESVAVIKKDMTPSDHLMRAGIGLTAYHRRHHPFDQGRTVGLEQEIKFKVHGKHELVGYIDRLTCRGDGVYEIHDYKTGQRTPTAQQLRQDRQLALYEIGVRQNFADAREVRLIWHYLSHDKQFASSRTAEELTSLQEKVSTLIEEIEAAAEFPCRRGPLCRWCEFEDLCR
jgi:putative RecB family exonuclease